MLRRLFGDDVAENDAHLSEYFIETPAYRMALSGEKRFIIGRKGAGKSALCQQLQKQLPQSGALCIPVAPQRIQFAALKLGLRDLAHWGQASDTILQRVWYYGLLCETAFALTKLFKKQHDSDLARIAAFVEKHYIFDEQIGSEKIPDYIIDRSLLRPREVLQFCRLAAEKADQRSHLKITVEDVADAENEFSRWKIDDLSNEFLFAYPGLKDKILQRFFGCSTRIAPAKLNHLLEEALTDPRGGEKHEWIENLQNVEALIQILYDIGFLKSRGQGKVWQSARHPDFNVALAEEFSVHPAFRRYLRIGHRK